MEFYNIWTFILDYFYKNPFEFWGFITSVICVYLNTRENVWGWFFAIIAAAFYIKVFYDVRLFGDLYLQIFFIIVSLYGWYEWLFGGENRTQLHIQRISTKIIGQLVFIFLISFPLMGWFLSIMKSNLPYLDAATTTISLIAQWLMARKYLENWLVWIFVNIIYVGMYYYNQIYLTSFLYVIFLGLATMGYFNWRKSLLVTKNATN
jgi:nicotinamide mononucleotide transporter